MERASGAGSQAEERELHVPTHVNVVASNQWFRCGNRNSQGDIKKGAPKWLAQQPLADAEAKHVRTPQPHIERLHSFFRTNIISNNNPSWYIDGKKTART